MGTGRCAGTPSVRGERSVREANGAVGRVTAAGDPYPDDVPSWRDAWGEALYGESGFYRHHEPSAHFRTSPMVSGDVAAALARLSRAAGLDAVLDMGAGGGELLAALHRADPGLALTGVDLRPRPAALPEDVDWTDEVPPHVEGLVVANEWLDTVPAPVVEVDGHGVARIVMIDDGEESLGEPVSRADPASAAWLDEWWPLGRPGQRAVVGLTRDRAARDLAERLVHGALVLVDYGHTRADRPSLGGIRCYRRGRQVPLALDGSADVTAPVAVDSVARAVDGHCLTQAEALTRLGVIVPPVGSLESAATAGRVAQLLDPAGLGAFTWVVTGRAVSPLAG